MTVPQHPWLWSAADEAAHHQRRYTRAGCCASGSRAAGFEIVHHNLLRHDAAAAHGRLATRRAGPVGAVRRDARARSSEAFGALLERPLMIERAAIRRGVRLPAGGSLALRRSARAT